MTGIIARAFASLILIGVWGWFNFMTQTIARLEAGRAAGLQFQSSDYAYYTSTMQIEFWSRFGLSTVFLFLILAAIWWKPVWRLYAAAASLSTLAYAAIPPRQAQAYYNTTYHTEGIIIGPSESAFWVPDVGDNKNSQSAFDSEEYLNSKKIPSKLFIVPHHKLNNSGGYWGIDAYVPDGRLYIVDRAPVTREWLADPKKGTSTQNEGFACQSSEGHNITVGVAISTTVEPVNAAKFMYNYGVHQPDGDQEDPNVIFKSVWYGRSLAEVMDTKIRSKVGIMVCEELMSHPILDDNRLAKEYMGQIRKDIEAYLATKGITLDFIGWADTWMFDADIQSAINRKFAATQDENIAKLLGPYASTIQSLAVADALRTKWNGVTPASVALTFLPQGLMDALGSIFKSTTAEPETSR